jgi:hypothetical protein
VILSVFRVAPKQVYRGANGAFYDQVLGGLTLNYLKIGFKSFSLFMWIEGVKAKRIEDKTYYKIGWFKETIHTQFLIFMYNLMYLNYTKSEKLQASFNSWPIQPLKCAEIINKSHV